MAKNRKLTEAEFDVYLQSHDYQEPRTEEESKIRREHDEYGRLTRRAKQRSREQGRAAKGQRVAWDDEWLDDEERRADRLRRNARTHKQRLKGMDPYLGGDSDRD